MATSGALIQTVAKTCWIPEVSVGTYYKLLREAGLTSKSGRGRSAAQMSVGDVANLLIALSSGQSAKEAPAMVDRVRRFQRHRSYHKQRDGLLPGARLQSLRQNVLDGVISGDNFGTFFENLLATAAEGKLPSILRKFPASVFPKNAAIARLFKPGSLPKNPDTSFDVEFNSDDEWVEITLSRDYQNREHFVDGAFFSPDQPDRARTPGMITSRVLLGWAVYDVCELLPGNGPLSHG